MALKVHNTVEHDTNVPSILRSKNHGASSRTTGGNCRVGLNWDPMMKSSVLSPFNFNLFNDIQAEVSDQQA